MKPTLITVLALTVAACAAESAPAEGEVPPPAASASSRFVSLRRPEDSSILEAPAIVRASAAASAEVTPPASLRIARVHVQVGDTVSAGDAIVDVYAPEVLDAAAAYLSTESRVRSHEQRANQLEALLGEGLVGRAEVFEQRAKAAELRAERLRATAILRSSGVEPKDASALLDRGVVTLHSPVKGVVTELPARIGRSYQPGAAPIARVLGEGAARVEVRTSKRWPKAKSVVFEGGDGQKIELNPSPVASVVVPSDGTVLTWFEPLEAISSPDGLLGTARISASVDLWEVPAGAIGQKGDKTVVMRRRGDEIEPVEVEIVAASGASALVRGPFEAADLVASEFPRGDAHVSGP